jgi:hypothetical protein
MGAKGISFFNSAEIVFASRYVRSSASLLRITLAVCVSVVVGGVVV